MTQNDRRKRRSSDIHEALAYQLEACREDARLDAMVLSDADGLCMAASGAQDTCGEVAAALPILGRKAGDFHGVLLSGLGPIKMMIQRFKVETEELYLCAVGGTDDLAARQIARSMRGVSRILAAV